MISQRPHAQLPTHTVFNTPPHLGDLDLWTSDRVLRETVEREGGARFVEEIAAFGPIAGAAETFELADQADRHPPELHAFDRYGMRIDQVEFHPAYHALMDMAIGRGLPNFAWRNEGPGAQVAHFALNYLFNQAEGGVMCPMSMTYSAVPVLRAYPGQADEWLDRVLSTCYDARDIPAARKTGATIGMFMTEKQGGSDVRANTTRAVHAGGPGGPGSEYRLTGHKYFCSAPMSDAFLTLARTDEGLSCFLVPRFTPDGARNRLFIQRLKNKLGNRSNASSEIEYHDTWATMIGEEGRGVRTIIDMVQANRVYCGVSSAALMRQALVRALHHCSHRDAFGARLIEQALMRNVLADLALESEAATALAFRVTRALDEAPADPAAAALARVGPAITKYWNCKRAPVQIGEALECHGGPGYVEESIMPRLYREAPVNSIWEGSGNIMCLDVLRAIGRDSQAAPALIAELNTARGGNRLLDARIDMLGEVLSRPPADLEAQARRLTESLAVAWQAALLVRHAPEAVADAFCASRLGDSWHGAFGTLGSGLDLPAVIARAYPT
ncbi:MAG: acyl-CoA dehydrogenase family protein [Burkholderiaceae bacterium]